MLKQFQFSKEKPYIIDDMSLSPGSLLAKELGGNLAAKKGSFNDGDTGNNSGGKGQVFQGTEIWL